MCCYENKYVNRLLKNSIMVKKQSQEYLNDFYCHFGFARDAQ